VLLQLNSELLTFILIKAISDQFTSYLTWQVKFNVNISPEKCDTENVHNYIFHLKLELQAFVVVRLSPIGIATTTGLLCQPQMIDDGDCRTVGGMKIGRGYRSTQRKPSLAPLCPP
jgi:hypothetical protein